MNDRCLRCVVLVCLLACIFVGVGFAQSGPAPLITNAAGRSTVSLDGTWRVIVDPYETGVTARLYENRKSKSKSDLVEYDFDTSGTLVVPGDWNSQRESLLFYEGPLWYQRYFAYQKRPQTRVFLYFGAANYEARAWLNGKKLGEHVGGFTAFDFDITDKLNDGDNSLVVEVNNTRRADGVPPLRTDWWNYGGLTRGVLLIEEPQAFIQDYFIQLAKGSMEEVAGWVKLSGTTASQPVTVEIPEAGLKKTVNTNSDGVAEFRFPAKLQLWSPEDPKLYRVVVSGAGDRVEEQIGFRSIETRGTQILLNGKPVFLRGISMHEEAPFRDGRGLSEDEDRTLLQWAKELGCNFVRLTHYPHNENTVRLADRMGLLVWSEIPVYWDITWSNPSTLENAQAQLAGMIARDRNRASVVMWSLSNETPISPERLQFLKALAESARKLDSTRLITSASDKVERPDAAHHVLNDPLGEYLDVLGLNEYIGWYEGKPEDADHMEWTAAYAKPVIVSEFGADALYGNHGDAQTRFTEEYQANLFEHQIGMLRRMPMLAGVSPWLLMDFRSPRRPLTAIQDFHNRKGLISTHGQRKQAFYVLQKFYREKAAAAK